MKKTIMLVALFITTSFAVKAQCEKTVDWRSSKTEFLDTAGNIQRSEDVPVDVTLTKTNITIVIHDSEEKTMHGDVTDYTCNWTNKQNGKTEFKSVITDPSGDVKHASVSIESVNGKITMLLRAEEEPQRIRLTIESYKEVE